MVQKTVKKTENGRPKSYSPELVHAIMAQSIDEGIPIADIRADLVKTKMCEDHGVSDTIRQESLEKLVDAMRAEFIEEEHKTLLKGVPGAVVATVEEAVAAAGRELLLIVARENAACKVAADLECEVLRQDKRNANWRISELETALENQAGATQQLERDWNAAVTQLADAHQQLRAIQAEIERVRQETGPVDRLLAELRNPAVQDDIRAALAEIVTTLRPVPEAS